MKYNINVNERGMNLVQMDYLQSIGSTIITRFRVIGNIVVGEYKLEPIVAFVIHILPIAQALIFIIDFEDLGEDIIASVSRNQVYFASIIFSLYIYIYSISIVRMPQIFFSCQHTIKPCILIELF